MAYGVFRPKRGTKAQWESVNPILKEGEMGIEVADAGVGKGLCKIKFGDGVTSWVNLPYGIAPETYFDGDTSDFVLKSDLAYSNADIAIIEQTGKSNLVNISTLSNSVNTINASISTGSVNNSNNLGNKSAGYYDAPIYEATLYASSWSGNNPYVQTVNLTKVIDSAPDVDSTFIFGSGCMAVKASTQSENEAILAALNIVNTGYATLGSNSVTVTVFEVPTSDVTVRWVIRRDV